MTKDRDDELERLRAENARLIGLLDAHGIAWTSPELIPASLASVQLSTDEKVTLFRRLFRVLMSPCAGKARSARQVNKNCISKASHL